MSNQQLYNQHRNNGVPHEEAAAALGVTPDAGRMLKSRYNKAKDDPTFARIERHIERSRARKEKAKRGAPQFPVITKEKLKALIDAEPETHTAVITATVPTVRKWTLPKINWQKARSYGISTLLVLVVIGHAGLVWYDCADRWSVPGAIGGGVVFLIVLAALLLASDETKPRTSEAALAFVFVTDFAAWFVHFPVFRDRAQIGDIETGVFAGFLCAASFTALYLFRDKNLD